MSPWKVILATMIIFGSGVVTGALVFKTTHHSARDKQTTSVPRPPKEAKTSAAPPWQLQRLEFLHKMDKQLDLTPEQRQKVEKIMHDSQDRTKPLWDTIAPQMREELNKVHQQIRVELTPEQQKKFEELLKAKPSRKTDDSQRRALTNNTPQRQPPVNTP